MSWAEASREAGVIAQCGACAELVVVEEGVRAGAMASRLGTSADRLVCRGCHRRATTEHEHSALAQKALHALALTGVCARVEYFPNFNVTVRVEYARAHGPDEALCVLDAADKANLHNHPAIVALRAELAREAQS